MVAVALPLVLAPAAGPVLAQQSLEGLPEGARLEVSEEHTTARLGEPQAHWVYVLDPVFPHLIASKVYLVDGDTLSLKGMINTGYVPNMAMSPDARQLYVAETYWSRGTRGERVDVVTFYDVDTLEATGEVILPRGRFLVVPKKTNAAMTPDGRYLLSYNMDPATSVSIVDVMERRYVADVDSPGCGLVFPTGNRSFSMLCPDGSFADFSFDAEGKAEVTLNDPFFDSEADPVFEHGVVSHADQRAFFISYEGMLYEVDISGGKMRVDESWSLVSEPDRAERWRPGGWQLAAYHAATDRLFVLMHRGERWTHKHAGEEVWVFDVQKNERIARVPIEHHAASVAVSQDDAPVLFTLSETASLSVYDATSFEAKGTLEGIGDSPFLLYVPGE
jgi:methylamine dehydrogenase heavy chain